MSATSVVTGCVPAFFHPTQNITYINNTVNVTNITYENSMVYNYGPDYIG